jgi:hypothetical protein
MSHEIMLPSADPSTMEVMAEHWLVLMQGKEWGVWFYWLHGTVVQ